MKRQKLSRYSRSIFDFLHKDASYIKNEAYFWLS